MDLREAINKRRAYRNLEPVEITADLVRDMAEQASLAPSCFNNQPWRFVFVFKPEMLKKLFTALAKGNTWAERSSMIIAVISRVDLDCRVKGRDYYRFDTGMAVGYLALLAAELDLVCHPIAGYDEEKVKEILNVPEDMTVMTLLITGKKSDAENPLLDEKKLMAEKNRPPRLKFEDFAFIDKYGK
jgi:nitroreductase